MDACFGIRREHMQYLTGFALHVARFLRLRRPGGRLYQRRADRGYNEEIVATRGVLEPGIIYLAKPYISDDVLHRLRELVRPSPKASGT